jgi:hypothetical protein
MNEHGHRSKVKQQMRNDVKQKEERKNTRRD